MDTNTQQSPFGHKHATIFTGVRVLNVVMEISIGTIILKVVMEISACAKGLKAVMAVSRLLGIKLHKPPTSNVVIIDLSFPN